jgi:hypothetical protein
MSALLPLLAMLACPIGMGLMMWLMMRGQHHTQSSNVTGAHISMREPARQVGGRFSFAGLCLNWQVLGGLLAIGGLVWFVAPNLIWLALPVLFLLACPLSMILMMRTMRHGQAASRDHQTLWHSSNTAGGHEQQLATLRAQQAALMHEIAALEATSASVRQPAANTRITEEA